MTFHPSSFIQRIVIRLGLDPRQKGYFFRVPQVRSDKGSMVALAAAFMIVVAVLIPVAMTLVANVRSNTSQAQLYVAGAQNAAKAGLEDALGYFVRQNKLLSVYASNVTVGQTPTWAVNYYYLSPTPTPFYYSFADQPFNPIYNTSNASYSDTFQGTTVNLSSGITHAFYGICNEYSVDAAASTLPAAGMTTAVYFARYEVNEQPNPTTTPGTPIPNAVHDISGNRIANDINGDGIVWGISSTGYIYKRSSYTVDQYGEYTVPYNVYPNKVLATAKAYTEFRKLSLTLPSNGSVTGDGAVYCSSAANITENTYSYLNGKVSGGFAVASMSGAATVLPSGAVTSTNFFGNSYSLSLTNNQPISDTAVFGMSLKDIQFIADYVGTQSQPLSIVAANKLSYFYGNLTYGPTQSAPYQQLNSTGILIVNGNLTLQDGGSNSAGTSQIAPSYYAGIIFCTGNLTIGAGCDVEGIVIMGYSTACTISSPTNNLTLVGNSSGFATLDANPNVVTQTLNYVAQYREDISARRVLLAFPGI